MVSVLYSIQVHCYHPLLRGLLLSFYERLLEITINVFDNDVVTVFVGNYFSVDNWDTYNAGFGVIMGQNGNNATAKGHGKSNNGKGSDGKGQGKGSDGKGRNGTGNNGATAENHLGEDAEAAAAPLTVHSLQSSNASTLVQALRALESGLKSALVVFLPWTGLVTSGLVSGGRRPNWDLGRGRLTRTGSRFGEQCIVSINLSQASSKMCI